MVSRIRRTGCDPRVQQPQGCFPIDLSFPQGYYHPNGRKTNFPSRCAIKQRMRFTCYFQRRGARFDAIQIPRKSLDCWLHDPWKFDSVEFPVAVQRCLGPTQETPVLVGHRIVRRRVVCAPIHTIRSA